MFRRKMLLTGLLALVGGLLAPATSQAAFVLRLTQGGMTGTVDLETGATTGTAPVLGTFTYNAGTRQVDIDTLRFGDFFIGRVTARNNLPGAPDGGAFTLFNNTDVARLSSSSSAALVFEISANTFTAVPNFGGYIVDTSFSGSFVPGSAGGNSVALASSIGNGTLFNTIPSSVATTGFVPGTGPNASETRLAATAVTGFNINSSATYTLTSIAGISPITGLPTGTVVDRSGVTPTVTAVPVPATAVMLLAAAPALGLARRLRRTPAAV